MKTLHPAVEIAAAWIAALVLTVVAYGPALHGELLSDDLNAIVQNEWVVGAPNVSGIFQNVSWWGQQRSDLYRPVTTLTFLWNRLAGGLDPSGYRIVNFAWHALCAALLFGLARMLGLRREAAMLAAALFAVLPIHSEPVIWIVGRAELGAASAVLAAAMLCLAYRRGGSLMLLVVAAFVVLAGALCKENAVTALAIPPIFLAIDRWFGKAESVRPGVARDVHAFAALACGVAVYALLRASAEGTPLNLATQSMLDNPLSVLPAGTRILGALAVFGRYVALTVWPRSLSIDYSYDALGIRQGFVASGDTLVAIAFVAVAIAAALRGPWRRDVVAVGLLLAAATYSIVSNMLVVIGTILGERLFYLPSAGIVLGVAAVAEPYTSEGSKRRYVVAALAALLVLASILVDRTRSADWRTPVSIFEAAVRSVPQSARARMELASAYGAAGRLSDAKLHFAKSLEILPGYAAASYNFGNVLAHAGELENAAAEYRRAIASSPRFLRAWHNLSLTERMLGHKDQWLEASRRSVEIEPGTASLVNELGEALLATGRYSEAVSVYDALAARGGATGASYFNRGVAHHHLGGCSAALEDYRLATKARDAPREAFVAMNGCLRELEGR